ncbi:MAG: aspartate carbamoyltransferase regulatory subunit [Candidatus Asgardarchaeia archaeon]
MSDEESTLKVSKIKDGTVIDHITPGKALAVLKLLGIEGSEGNVVSVVMNVASKKMGKKDVIKIENRELTKEEVSKISLISPRATINIIRGFKVVKKTKVEIPDYIEGVIKCANPVCITNSKEPLIPKFRVISKNPVVLRCLYCKRYTTEEDILKQFEVLE